MPIVPLSSLPASEAASFHGLTRGRLAARLADLGYPAYRASQLFSWVYRKRQRDPAAMANLPRALRDNLQRLVDLRLPGVARHAATPDDDTHKFYDQIAWFTGADDKPALSLKYTGRAGGFDFVDHVLNNRGLTKRQLSWHISDHYPLWAEFDTRELP